MIRHILALLLLPGAAVAQTAAPPAGTAPTAAAAAADAAPQQPPAEAWVARPVAEVQAIDKISARLTTLTIRAGGSATFGALTIGVRFCLVRPADQAPDTTMFLDIVDSHLSAPQFHGWMILSAPAANQLQHPVYDVRPLACHA